MDKISKKIKVIKNNINKIRKFFNSFNIDGYLVPKNDEYFQEYANKDRLKFISNFDGSAGLAVIMRKINYLFVDGRYTAQAKIQSGKNYKILQIPEFFPSDKIKNKKLKIGYDPKLFTSRSLRIYFQNKINLVPINKNLIDLINYKKNKNIYSSFYTLNKEVVGESTKSKINRLTKILNKNKVDYIFVSAPENVAWLLNIRGNDSPYSPIPNSRLILEKNRNLFFFSNKKKIRNIKKLRYLNKIHFFDESDFKKILFKIKSGSFIIDEISCSAYFKNLISNKFKIKNLNDPIYYLKSKKNAKEIVHIKNAHLADGVALTKFLYWIKKNIRNNVSELDAEKKLEKFRRLNKNFLSPSFNTIAGSGPNGAIIHYRATKKTNRLLNKKEIFLCDSGGQYKYGTTDVTRTICFAEPKKYIKDIFTKVLKGHIAVVTSNLNTCYNGKLIDVRARKYLKKNGLDYAHGTGHGVGFFSNVHEGPQAISKFNSIKLKEGMVLSNEPGFYKKGKFGIRIENLVYVKKYKRRLFFENLTLVPIDKELINFKLLNKQEQNYLFNYHLNIYSKLSKYLNKNEKKWLISFL